MSYHCYTYDWTGSNPYKKGSYSSQSEAEGAAHGAGMYSAIVTKKGGGVLFLNPAAWAWGGMDKLKGVISNPLSVVSSLGDMPDNVANLVRKARDEGNV